MRDTTVTIKAGATFWSRGQVYVPGETLSVTAMTAVRGRRHGIFV